MEIRKDQRQVIELDCPILSLVFGLLGFPSKCVTEVKDGTQVSVAGKIPKSPSGEKSF